MVLNKKYCSVAVLLIVSFTFGCSLKSKSFNPKLSIILKEQASSNLSGNLLGLKSFITTTPTSTSDFSCFGLNITGSGIASDLNLLQGCTSSDNFRGKGVGKTTHSFTRNQTVEVDIVGGPNRSIDVYGIYPPDSSCGGATTGGTSGGGNGYYLGGVTQDILENKSVTIPISFAAGTSPSVTCTNVSSNQATYKYYVYALRQVANANSIFSFESNPTTGALTPTSAPNLTVASVLGGIANNIVVHPNNRFLYVSTDRKEIFGYSIDQTNGNLIVLNGGASFITNALESHCSIKISSNGNYIYVVNSGAGQIQGYSLDSTTGIISGGATITNPTAAGTPKNLFIHPYLDIFYNAAGGGGGGLSSYTYNPTTGDLAPLANPVANTAVAGTLTDILVVSHPLGTAAYATIFGPTTSIHKFSLDMVGNFTNQGAFGTAKTSNRLYQHPTNDAMILVANDDAAGCVTSYSITAAAATLAQLSTTGNPNAALANCSALALHPNGNYIYVADFDPADPGGVWTYQIDPTTGAISGGTMSDADGFNIDIAIAKVQQP